jgi:predicted nuclease of predicted toxin-antitoxin system
MKILLDENIDVRFKTSFPESIEVYTVQDMGWKGVKNGDLIQLLSQHEFDFFVVVDKNIPYQQNTKKLPCKVIVLDVIRNTLQHLIPLVPQVLSASKKDDDQNIIIIKA